MLHTKFRENWPASPGEDFLRVFTIYGRGSHLGHVTQMQPSWSCDPDAPNKLSFPLPKRLHIKLCFDRASGFGEEDV